MGAKTIPNEYRERQLLGSDSLEELRAPPSPRLHSIRGNFRLLLLLAGALIALSPRPIRAEDEEPSPVVLSTDQPYFDRQLELAEKDTSRARALFDNIGGTCEEIKARPNLFMRCQRLCGNVLADKESYAEARERYESIVKTFVRSRKEQCAHNDFSMQVCMEASSLNEEAEKALKTIRPAACKAEIDRGEIDFKRAAPDASQKTLESVRTQCAGSVIPPIALLRYQQLIGDILARQKSYAEAKAAYEDVIRIYEKHFGVGCYSSNQTEVCDGAASLLQKAQQGLADTQRAEQENDQKRRCNTEIDKAETNFQQNRNAGDAVLKRIRDLLWEPCSNIPIPIPASIHLQKLDGDLLAAITGGRVIAKKPYAKAVSYYDEYFAAYGKFHGCPLEPEVCEQVLKLRNEAQAALTNIQAAEQEESEFCAEMPPLSSDANIAKARKSASYFRSLHPNNPDPPCVADIDTASAKIRDARIEQEGKIFCANVQPSSTPKNILKARASLSEYQNSHPGNPTPPCAYEIKQAGTNVCPSYIQVSVTRSQDRSPTYTEHYEACDVNRSGNTYNIYCSPQGIVRGGEVSDQAFVSVKLKNTLPVGTNVTISYSYEGRGTVLGIMKRRGEDQKSVFLKPGETYTVTLEISMFGFFHNFELTDFTIKSVRCSF